MKSECIQPLMAQDKTEVHCINSRMSSLFRPLLAHFFEVNQNYFPHSLSTYDRDRYSFLLVCINHPLDDV
jgi:hypothetical protein